MALTEIAAGTATRRSLGTGAFVVSDVSFAPDVRLSWHEHPRGCLAVVVAGAVRKRFRSHAAELARGGIVTMPPAEEHEDIFGSEGARLVVLESDDGLDAVECSRDW